MLTLALSILTPLALADTFPEAVCNDGTGAVMYFQSETSAPCDLPALDDLLEELTVVGVDGGQVAWAIDVSQVVVDYGGGQCAVEVTAAAFDFGGQDLGEVAPTPFGGEDLGELAPNTFGGEDVGELLPSGDLGGQEGEELTASDWSAIFGQLAPNGVFAAYTDLIYDEALAASCAPYIGPGAPMMLVPLPLPTGALGSD